MKGLFDLTGHTALITGASSGMGKAISEALGVHGAQVIISSNDVEGCKATVTEFQRKEINAVSMPCDISSNSEIDAMFLDIESKKIKVDILQSCVGIASPSSFMEIDSGLYTRTMDLNLQSAIYLTKKVLPGMIKRRKGVITYLASIAAVRGNKNIGLYGISKAGLVQLARNIAVEHGPDNIRANCISPGLIQTPFSDELMSNEAFMLKRLALTPLRRIGQVAEIAGVAVMLASKAGAFITGQNIIVDGGTTIGDGN